MSKLKGIKISSIRKQYLRSNKIAFNDKYINKYTVTNENNKLAPPNIPIPTESSNTLKINFQNNGSTIIVSTMNNGKYVDNILEENKMYYISSSNTSGEIYCKLKSNSNFIVCGDQQISSSDCMFKLTKGEYTDLLIISNKNINTTPSPTTPHVTTPSPTTPTITSTTTTTPSPTTPSPTTPSPTTPTITSTTTTTPSPTTPTITSTTTTTTTPHSEHTPPPTIKPTSPSITTPHVTTPTITSTTTTTKGVQKT